MGETEIIRYAESKVGEVNDDADFTDTEKLIYSALLATDTDLYHGTSVNLMTRARATALLIDSASDVRRVLDRLDASRA